MKLNKKRLMELAGLVNEAELEINEFPYEPGLRFTEGQYTKMSMQQVKDELKRISIELPQEMSVYLYTDPQDRSYGRYVVVDLDEGGMMYSLTGGDTSMLRKIAKEAISQPAVYTNREGVYYGFSRKDISSVFGKIQKHLTN